jgi:glycosyltransferase involved in cell wall biosynthesis
MRISKIYEKKPIKIAYVIDQLAIGGTENQLLDLIRHLDKSKFIIYLICLRNTSYFKKVVLPCEKKVIEVYSLASLNTLKKMFLFSKWLRKKKIDIVQAFFFDATVFSTLASKLSGNIKMVSSKRDLGFWYTPKLLVALKGLRYLIDVYIVNSFAIKQTIILREKANPKKIYVIYNGINPPSEISSERKQVLRKKIGLRDGDTVIGIVANLNRWVKRVDLFIEAASKIIEKYDKIKFVVVGGGCLLPELIKMAKKKKVEKYIVFTDLQTDPKPIIKLFDIGVLTSDSEGFSNSVLEYMANGIPVIVTNSGGSKEIVDHCINGYLFEPGDAISLSKYIDKLLLKNEEFKNKMKEKNRIKAMEYYWPNIIEQYEEIYFKIKGC